MDEAAARLAKEGSLAELEEKRALMEVLSAQLAEAVAEKTELAAVAAGLERAVQEEKDAAAAVSSKLESEVQEEKDMAKMLEGQHTRALKKARDEADESMASLHAAEKQAKEAEKNAQTMAVSLAQKASVEINCRELQAKVAELEELSAGALADQVNLLAEQPVERSGAKSVAEDGADGAGGAGAAGVDLQRRILEKEDLIATKEQQILEQESKQLLILQQVAVLLREQEAQKQQLAAADKSLRDERGAGADMTVALDTAYRRVSELENAAKKASGGGATAAGVEVAQLKAERERVVELEGALGAANEMAKAARVELRLRDEELAQMQLQRATAAAEAAMNAGSTPTRGGGGGGSPAGSVGFGTPVAGHVSQTPASLAQADALAVRVGELESQLQASDGMYEELQAETIGKEEELANMGKKLRELRAQVRQTPAPSSPPRGASPGEMARERAQREEVVAALQLASEELKEAQGELVILRREKESWEVTMEEEREKAEMEARRRRARRQGAEGEEAAALEESEGEVVRLKGCIEELVAQLGVLEGASRKARAADRDTIDELESRLESLFTTRGGSSGGGGGGIGLTKSPARPHQDYDSCVRFVALFTLLWGDLEYLVTDLNRVASRWGGGERLQMHQQQMPPPVPSTADAMPSYGVVPSPTLPGVRFDPPTHGAGGGMVRPQPPALAHSHAQRLSLYRPVSDSLCRWQQGWNRFDLHIPPYPAAGMSTPPPQPPRSAWMEAGTSAANVGGEGDWQWSPPPGQASSGNRGRAWQEAFAGFHTATR